MKSSLTWTHDLSEGEDKSLPERYSINDIAYKPDGSEILVACGRKLIVLDGADGTKFTPLFGHKGTIYCVSYSFNGEKFASGSADKCVIIWTEQHEGILKYNHNDAISKVMFCPVASILVSCAATDFGIWMIDQKSVNKQKVSSRICSCAWTRDGHFFALGFFTGHISIRNKSGEEKMRVEKPLGHPPAWTLCFCPNKAEASDQILVVGDWVPSLSFYTMDGNLVNKEKALEFDPCTLEYFEVEDFLLIGGSDRQVNLFTKDGVKLGTVCDQRSWISVAKKRPGSQHVLVGCYDGTLSCYQLTFTTINGLYKERYAYRENMTDVVVQHLITNKKVRIKCKDLIKKIAIHKNKLAVQLTDKIVVHQLINDNETEMTYKPVEKIPYTLDCSLLVISGKHVILCQEKRIQCYDFRGLKEHEWVVESLIRYIKIIGGPLGKEGLLVGLKSGQILKIFVHNPFPVEILHVKRVIRCIDLSMKRQKIAVVDEQSILSVYDLRSKELLFQEPSANSVAWNSHNEDLIAFTGGNLLRIKAGDFPAHQQRMQGYVVGFSGSKVFCMQMYMMFSVEVPLSNQLYQYLEHGNLSDAYTVACLGVTETDWQLMAFEAMERLDVNIAKKSFIRIRNLRFLELLHRFEENKHQNKSIDHQFFLAELKAYQGRLDEAARLFIESGNEQTALDMFTDLKMFDKAQELLNRASTDTQKVLIRKRADWAKSVNEPKTAAEMYVSAGDYEKAINIMVENSWVGMIVMLGRKLSPDSHHKIISRIASELSMLKEPSLAAEMYQKINDIESLISAFIASQKWDEIFRIIDKYPEHKEKVYIPYANFLAENDRFEEAQKAFHKAGKQDEALKVLQQLSDNAVDECRYKDAGYYYWLLSQQYLDRAKEFPQEESDCIGKFDMYQKYAEIYYTYHSIQRYTQEPFTSHQPEGLLNAAKFLWNRVDDTTPRGVSKVAVLYTMAKQGKLLGAYRTARYALDKLQKFRIPERFQQSVEIATLGIRAKPFQDAETLLPMCYKCSTSNAMLNEKGNMCSHCRTSFVFSFVSFDILPIVEFEIEEGIVEEEARQLIEAEPPLNTTKQKESKSKVTQKTVNQALPQVFDRMALLSLNRTEVIICEWPKPLKCRYYKNLISEISVTKCGSCFRLFHTDDYELAVLQEGHCPFCRRENLSYSENMPQDSE